MRIADFAFQNNAILRKTLTILRPQEKGWQSRWSMI